MGKIRVTFLRVIDKIKAIRHNVPIGIHNLIIWFPVIWYNRWWDEHYIYEILYKQFSLMAKNFDKYGIHASVKRQVKQLKTCELLCKRLVENDYITSCPPNEVVEWSPLTIISHDEGFIGKPLDADYDGYMEQQDVNLLLKLMNKHIRTWWD